MSVCLLNIIIIKTQFTRSKCNSDHLKLSLPIYRYHIHVKRARLLFYDSALYALGN